MAEKKLKLTKPQRAFLESMQGKAFNGAVNRITTIYKLSDMGLIGRLFDTGHRAIYVLTEDAYELLNSTDRHNKIADGLEDAASIYKNRYGAGRTTLTLEMAAGAHRELAKKEKK